MKNLPEITKSILFFWLLNPTYKFTIHHHSSSFIIHIHHNPFYRPEFPPRCLPEKDVPWGQQRLLDGLWAHLRGLGHVPGLKNAPIFLVIKKDWTKKLGDWMGFNMIKDGHRDFSWKLMVFLGGSWWFVFSKAICSTNCTTHQQQHSHGWLSISFWG